MNNLLNKGSGTTVFLFPTHQNKHLLSSCLYVYPYKLLLLVLRSTNLHTFLFDSWLLFSSFTSPPSFFIFYLVSSVCRFRNAVKCHTRFFFLTHISSSPSLLPPYCSIEYFTCRSSSFIPINHRKNFYFPLRFELY